MAVNTIPATGTVLRIGTTAASPAGDSFNDIGEIIEITGSWGVEWGLNEFPRLATGEIAKTKSSQDYGEVTVSVGVADTNAGLDAAEAAAADTTSSLYNIQIELNNSGGSNGTIYDFKALVTSFKTAIGDVNSEVTHMATFSVRSVASKTAAA